LAVVGSAEAAELAARAGAEVIAEVEPQGQNAAAQRAIDFALAEGAAEIVLLSSDLPLVTRDVVARLLEAAGRLAKPAALAAPATGRGGLR
jgi:2-phospho-L-lactate guanylyltransferase (CobY/MobA/RfbA family)